MIRAPGWFAFRVMISLSREIKPNVKTGIRLHTQWGDWLGILSLYPSYRSLSPTPHLSLKEREKK